MNRKGDSVQVYRASDGREAISRVNKGGEVVL
jgi:hypothetical protein